VRGPVGVGFVAPVAVPVSAPVVLPPAVRPPMAPLHAPPAVSAPAVPSVPPATAPTGAAVWRPAQVPGEVAAGQAPKPTKFEDLTSIDPQPRWTLEHPGCPEACRLIDLFCPIGRGQRALIVSPPKAGKTSLLKDISLGIARNHQQAELIALLIDERPEEVTDFKRFYANLATGGIKAEVIASSNDHGVERHVHVATSTIEEAKRRVLAGRHVVIILDSLTRLGRSFNLSRRHASSGRTLTGGIDARALEVPRQIFGSARNTEEAGSLTIVASCLVDTGSAMDQVIFEEFKGSGNMELILDRKISERRLFPAINLAASGTRKEHLLMGPDELKTMTALRRRLLAMPPHVQVEQLLGALKRFKTNAEMVGATQGA
jgi:transcription termination factor Rho